jgi:hypothetical protein
MRLPKAEPELSIWPFAARIGGVVRAAKLDPTREDGDMKQYLLSVYQPDGPIPEPAVLQRIMADLAVVNQEMRAAGAWVFTAGLHPASTATVAKADGGDVLLTDGPFVEGKEHLGGFTVITAPDLDAALHWATKLATVLEPLSVEVRPIQDEH